ncbi:Lrp/AsnC family transcriptional regulator [Candidatus Bathyarchaeota archaeon]|nr:Lrp/AsnC family transcriptional regulator [Candidatus Bathyarchaeota archaeon]
MKETERKLICELMKNSRRSDRDLAKALKVSQPTVTRIRSRLEKEGYIREYTMIPSFARLGYELMAITFVKLKRVLSEEEIEDARKIAKERLEKTSLPFFMLERGMGLGYQGVIISFHESYASYLALREWLREFTFLEISEIESFLVNLKDKVSYAPPTFKLIAKHLETLGEKQGKEKKQ